MNTLNFSVKAKLFTTLAVSSIVMIVVGVLGLSSTKSSNGHLDAIFSNRFMPTGWVGTIESHAREVLEKAEDIVIRQDSNAARAGLDLMNSRGAEVSELASKLRATDLTEKERAIVEEFGRHRETVFSSVHDALLAAQAGTFGTAETALLEKARPAYENLTQSGDALLAMQIEVAEEMRTSADTSFKRNSGFIVAAIVIGIGLAGLMSFLLIRSIVSALNAAVNIADRIAGGELGNDVRVETRDELGRLLDSL
jgi:methyl-accepting chemotaxis protein